MENNSALPPGPKGLPILGNTLQFRLDPLHFVREMQQTYGRMATVHFGKLPVVMFFRPEHVRYFLVEKPRNYVKPGLGNLRFLLGDGLLTTDGDFHRQQRRLGAKHQPERDRGKARQDDPRELAGLDGRSADLETLGRNVATPAW